MSIYAKLAKARVQLQEMELTKSGVNHFVKVKVQKYNPDGKSYFVDEPMPYFELKDFLPKVNSIFLEVGLCSVVRFTKELATLTIFDTESEGKIEFSSPMPNVPTENKNGSIPSNNLMQSIGALETYQRRYLYVTALEIVENDLIDVTDFKGQKQEQSQAPKPKSPTPYNNKTQQNTTSTPPKPQAQKTFAELMERLKAYKTQEELAAKYEMMEKYVREHFPDSLGEFDLAYNDRMLELM